MTLVRVVGAAVLRADPVTGRRTVLAGRRREPPPLAGLWEFPGGKVEIGETDERALVRELDEELGVQAVVGARIGPEVSIRGTAVLIVYLVTITGEPALLDHDAHRWLDAGQLGDVPWIAVDRPVLEALRPLLG